MPQISHASQDVPRDLVTCLEPSRPCWHWGLFVAAPSWRNIQDELTGLWENPLRPSISQEDARRGPKNIKNSMIESVQKPTTGTHCTDIGQVALLAVTKKTITHTGPYLLSSSKPANRPQHANGSKGQSGEKSISTQSHERS